MITITQSVEEIIFENPFLYQGLTQKIVNFHQIAKNIKKEVELRAKKEVKTGSIVMALLRFSKKISKNDLGGFIKSHLHSLQIKVPISEIVLEKNTTNLKKLEKVFFKKDELLGVIVGDKEINVVCTNKIANFFINNFNCKNYLSPLASMSIFFDEKLVKTPGLFYYLTSLFFVNNVNIVEIISTYTEVNIIIDFNDIQKSINFLSKQLVLQHCPT